MNCTMQDAVLGALCGLLGALESSAATPSQEMEAHAILLSALRAVRANPGAPAGNAEPILGSIDAIKYAISPSCKTCPSPCGNTSVRDIGSLSKDPATQPARQKLAAAVLSYADGLPQSPSGEQLVPLFRAIMALGYAGDAILYESCFQKLIP